ncbi:MAG: PEP-CTERM sorting domain-containing protein [Planctomycetales bacterium]|nr:PEP-CTERM sorting domain-containing protein [Planctomycetales bacterium]
MSSDCWALLRSMFRSSLLSVISAMSCGLLVSSMPAHAEIVVTFDTSVPDPLIAGASGILDVYVATDAGSQLLDAYQVAVELTPSGASPGPVGGLVFAPTQADAELTIGGVNGYVFFSNSLDLNQATNVGILLNSGSGFLGYDATWDLTPMTLTTVPRLLFRLDLNAVAAGTYAIDVNPGSTSFAVDQLAELAPSIPFSSTPGSLTVSAVPEPSSLLLLALVGVAVVGSQQVRRLRCYLQTSCACV